MFFPIEVLVSIIATPLMWYTATGTNPFITPLDYNISPFMAGIIIGCFYSPFSIMLDFVFYKKHKNNLKEKIIKR